MIRSPLGLRIETDADVRDRIRRAAEAGARGVVLDAIGDLSPDRLSETGRRELRHALASVELKLIALNLPTRRPFDSPDRLDDRIGRAERAFQLAYELGTNLVLIRLGEIPAENDPALPRRVVLESAVRDLERRADKHGITLAIDTDVNDPARLCSLLSKFPSPVLAASVDPGELLRGGHDPVQATRDLGNRLAHAHASDSAGSNRPAKLANPRGFGFAPGVVDWEEMLGALEESGYRGFLTVRPDPDDDPIARFQAYVRLFQAF